MNVQLYLIVFASISRHISMRRNQGLADLGHVHHGHGIPLLVGIDLHVALEDAQGLPSHMREYCIVQWREVGVLGEPEVIWPGHGRDQDGQVGVTYF